jgi:predicted dehydrogenase
VAKVGNFVEFISSSYFVVRLLRFASFKQKSTMLNIAILGPGKIAKKFADDLQRVPDVRLYAVASSSLERAEAFAKNYDCPHALGSYEALAQLPGIDLVYIATPHVFHYEHTMFCLQNNLNVLCEKPFSMHPDQTRAMIAEARSRNLFLMEALWTLFIPAYNKALELARSGAIGPVHTAKADFGFVANFNPQSRIFDPALGASSLLDIGIYPVLFFLDLLGRPSAKDIQAAATLTPQGIDSSCVFTFRYPGTNQIATGHSTIAADTPIEAAIYGAEGIIMISRRFHHPQQVILTRYDNSLPQSFEMPYEGWGYQFEIAHVAECLRAKATESQRLPLSFTQDLSEVLWEILEKSGVRF